MPFYTIQLIQFCSANNLNKTSIMNTQSKRQAKSENQAKQF